MQAEQLDVIVVDDHLTVRRGIELVLAEAGFRIVGAGGSLAEAETLLSRRRFDVALLDAQLGDDSVIALVESVLREHPRASIVLYTGHTGPESELSQAARAGARGFVLKSSPGARLTGALRAVAGGGSYVDPSLAPLLAGAGEAQGGASLTERELEVLELLADGLSGQRIAERLFLSPETVRTHIRNASRKLGARTRVQAVAMVVRRRSAG